VGEHNTVLGRDGEDLTAAHYRSRGYTVLARNWRCARGEIDLVCARGETLVFCEVKARSHTATGHPLEAVTATKQMRLRRLAAAFLVSQSTYWAEIRFDVASVMGRRLQVVEGAF
jgi:putative endonuclease